MNFYVVYLESGQLVALQENWIQNPILGKKSKVFISENDVAFPNFALDPLFYINKKIDAVYNAFVYKKFGKIYFFK